MHVSQKLNLLLCIVILTLTGTLAHLVLCNMPDLCKQYLCNIIFTTHFYAEELFLLGGIDILDRYPT